MSSASLVPLMRYRDVPAAIDWLCDAFEFEQRSVVPDGEGGIAYAELSYGNGVVMIGPVGQTGLDTLLKQPSDLDGANTQSCYVAVEDVEAHYKHALAAGAAMVLEFNGAGSDRAYAARDPEGHIWNFGAYAPWRAPAPAPVLKPKSDLYWPASRLALAAHSAMAASVLVLATVSAAGVWQLPVDVPEPASIEMSKQPAAPALTNLTVTVTPPAKPNNDLARSVERERSARIEAQDQAAVLKKALESEAHARREASRSVAALREQLAREQEARTSAEAASSAAKAQLIREREAKLEINSQDRARSEAIAKIETQEPAPASLATPAAPETPQTTTTGSLNIPPPPAAPALHPVTTEPLPAFPAEAEPQPEAPSAKVPEKPKPKAAIKRPRVQKSAQSKQKKTAPEFESPFFAYD